MFFIMKRARKSLFCSSIMKMNQVFFMMKRALRVPLLFFNSEKNPRVPFLFFMMKRAKGPSYGFNK